jgi:serine/threonine protein kinase, bacterial
VVEEPPVGDTTAEWHDRSQFGPYRLTKLLGRGGFGEVYEAYDTKKKRTVALKLLPPSYSGNPAFRNRLFREASTAGRLNEPHVVPIHDYGEIDGRLYIDMRLIAGSDLRVVLDDGGPLDPQRAVAIVEQIASALDAAHAERIVHRDVKPANILLTPGNFACLVDFGLANAATDAKLTTAGNTVGTFAYMAPERLANEEIDHRADIYALTCVLYECLTGEAPYPIADMAALIAAHLTSPIPRPSLQRPGIPSTFDEVIAKGMAKTREDRYSTAGELAAAARKALTATPQIHDDTLAGSPPARGRRRSARLALLAAAVVLILAAATAIIAGVSHHRHTSAASVAPPASTAATAAPVVPGTAIVSIPVGRHPEGIAIDPTTHTAYTANFSDSTVSVIDTAARTVTATIPVGKGPEGIAVDPAAGIACTANNRDDTVSVIDLANRQLLATVPVGSQPWGVALDTTSHTAYSTNLWDDNLSVIDLAHHTVTATIRVGKNPFGIALNPDNHSALTANGDNTVAVIDVASRQLQATVAVGSDPRGVAVDPAIHSAYATNEADGTLSIIDLTNNTVAATVRVGKHPYGVATDPTTHAVYVANETDNTVSVVDPTKHAVTGTIRLSKDPWGVAVDPTTHTTYTTNHDNTVSVIAPNR